MDSKRVMEVVTLEESEIHTKSSEDVSDDEEEEEKENWSSVDDDDDDFDALIASELNKMTMKEREEAMFDLHGVSEVMEEAPDMVARKFEQLESILAKKRSNEKAAAYNLAASMSPDYVQNRKFLFMFLRADRFHAKKAAHRVISHFRKKLELFGASKLCKDMTLEDLDPSAMKVLETGHCTLLPARDRADRLIIYCDGPRRRYKDPIDQVRLLCLLLHSLKCGISLHLVLAITFIGPCNVLHLHVLFSRRRGSEKRDSRYRIPCWFPGLDRAGPISYEAVYEIDACYAYPNCRLASMLQRLSSVSDIEIRCVFNQCLYADQNSLPQR